MRTSVISFVDALKIAGALALVYVALQLTVALVDVLLIFFTALILAIAMDKPISQLEDKKIPRIVSALVIYVTMFAAVVFLLYLIFPSLVVEVRNFVSEYGTYSEALPSPEEVSRFDISPYIKSFSDTITGSSGAVLSLVFKTFGSFTTFLAIFFIALFLTLQKGGLKSFIFPFVPIGQHQVVMQFFDSMQDRVSSWLWGKTISSLIVALATYIGLFILGIPYTLTLAILALFFNYIPFLGPIIAAVPAVLLALALYDIPTALVVVLLYFVINGILESFLLTPLLMKRAVEINSGFLILSVLSGAYLGGVLGIVISIPIAAIIYLALSEYWQYRERKHSLVKNQ